MLIFVLDVYLSKEGVELNLDWRCSDSPSLGYVPSTTDTTLRIDQCQVILGPFLWQHNAEEFKAFCHHGRLIDPIYVQTAPAMHLASLFRILYLMPQSEVYRQCIDLTGRHLTLR